MNARLKATAEKFNQDAKRFGLNRFTAWCSELYCFMRFGASPEDFFRYEFYKKSNRERNRFITYRRSRNIIRQYNDPAFVSTLVTKTDFNRRFADYIKRDWLEVEKASESEFRAFLEKHGCIIMKPLRGGQGRGIFKLTAEEYDPTQYESYRDYLAEELLQQHPDMSRLNPSSVNTVRVMTFRGHVIACALRTGADGAIVDNLHSSGVCAHLDTETGLIDAPCINTKLEHYLFHPTTGVKMIGYSIPLWQKVIQAAERAASEIPQIQYIGWDVAILENDVAIIEANHDPGHDLVQMIAQTGLYETIQSLL